MTWKVMSIANARHSGIHGYVSKGFDAVRDAFIENFSRRRELGAACCVYRHGQKVVDLWGGIRNGATGEPWQEKADVLRGTTFSLMSKASMRGDLIWLNAFARQLYIDKNQIEFQGRHAPVLSGGTSSHWRAGSGP